MIAHDGRGYPEVPQEFFEQPCADAALRRGSFLVSSRHLVKRVRVYGPPDSHLKQDRSSHNWFAQREKHHAQDLAGS